MAEKDFQEKTEKASDRRRAKAREEGKVARSTELNAAAIIGFGFMLIYFMGPHAAGQFQALMIQVMSNAPAMATSDPTFYSVIVYAMRQFFMILMPILVVMVIVAIAINVVQVGFKISPKAFEPKWEKLNLISGLKRLFALKSLVHLVRDTLKLAVVGLVAYMAIKSEFPTFFLLPDQTIGQIAATMGHKAMIVTLKIAAAILVIAVLDYFYQKYEFEKSIKMSKQELKEEHKDSDGSPQLKARVRQLQREMSRSRMMDDVPTADVVITNPTRIAVALKYDTQELGAPCVVAKGQRLIAEKIRDLAKQHDIPIVEDQSLARALFKLCDVGQLVPANLYRAVAEVLAYVYRLKGHTVS